MTLISLEDAKAEVRKVVSDFKTRYDINYRLNSLPSIELEDEAEQTEPSNSEKPNNCEPKICDTCRYYNSNIPCGSTPSACKEADKFAEEFVDGLKKLKPQKWETPPKFEHKGFTTTCVSVPAWAVVDEPQTEAFEEPNYYDPALWE